MMGEGYDYIRAFCLSGTLNYTRYFFKARFGRKFVVNDHHVKICQALDDVIDGKIKKLIINIAPRYSKTELVVKNFISYGLAINPSAKFLHLSYSDDLANDNSEEVRDIVKSEEYKCIFPYVGIKKTSDAKKNGTQQKEVACTLRLLGGKLQVLEPVLSMIKRFIRSIRRIKTFF